MRLRDLVREKGTWGYVVLVLGMFFRPLGTETFYFRDLYLLFYPKKLLFASALRTGQVPLWDPFTNGGQPYLAMPANFAFHPSNLLYFVLPPIVAFNLVLVLHVLFCAVAAYWLARTTRLSEPAAFAAGAVFAFCGYTLSTANLTPLLLALPWIPMTIGLTHRALRDRRSIVPAAIAGAMPLFCAAAEVTSMLFATLIVWTAFSRYDVTVRRRAMAVAIVMAAAIGLTLVQTLPATTIISQSARGSGRSYESFTSWSVAPQRLPELLVPRFFGDTDALRDERYWGRGLETLGYPYILSLYVGIPAFLLALAGACAPERRALAVFALIAIVLSLGRHLPFFRLIYDYVPFVTIFRYPVKAMLAALLPIAILTGCGVELVVESGRARRVVAWSALTLAFTAATIATATAMNPAWVARFAQMFSFKPLDASDRALLAWGFVHAAVAATALVVSRGNAWTIAAIVTLDLAIAGYRVNDYAPRSIFDEPPLASAVREVARGNRFYSAEREQVLRAPGDDLRYLARWRIETLDGYTAAAFGIPVVFHTDYDGLAPWRMSRLSGVMSRLPWERRRALLDRAGVGAILTEAVLSLPDVVEVGSFATAGQPLRLYANRHAAPARFVSDVDRAHDDQDAARRTAFAPDLSRVVLANASAGGNCGAAPVRLAARSLDRALYEVDAPCNGFVVFAENHDDGWRATIDGHPAAEMPADYAFTAVAIGRGHHVIERKYRPPRLWLGLAGSLLTALVLAVGYIVNWPLSMSSRTRAMN